jgi:hypothetical protein
MERGEVIVVQIADDAALGFEHRAPERNGFILE